MFNDEHVIPNWVQRECGLQDKTIQLPNGTKFPYSKYLLPCCVDCNSFLGSEFEKPIATAISQGSDAFSGWYESEIFRVFLWLNLICLKVHLKDNLLRIDRDLRKPDVKIGSLHDWSQLHHCHALVRASRLGIPIEAPTTLGSMFCLHLGSWADEDDFDYKDHLPSHTMMIRVGRTAFIASFNDSQGVLQGLMPKIEKLSGEINKVQLLELFTEFQFLNYHLKYRPQYVTVWNQTSQSFEIKGLLPEMFELLELDYELRRQMLVDNIVASIPNFSFKGLSEEESLEKLMNEDVTFLPS